MPKRFHELAAAYPARMHDVPDRERVLKAAYDHLQRVPSAKIRWLAFKVKVRPHALSRLLQEDGRFCRVPYRRWALAGQERGDEGPLDGRPARGGFAH